MADKSAVFLQDYVKLTVQAILDIAYKEFEDASGQSWGRCQTCRNGSSARSCHSTRLGVITKFMSETQLPLSTNQKPSPLLVSTSLKSMEAAFEDCRVDKDRDERVYIGSKWHANCFHDWFRLREVIDKFRDTRLDKIKGQFDARFSE